MPDLKPALLYKDDNILVIDKPAGLPVHAGSGGGANLEDFFPELQFDAKQPPHLAHRLDRDTSGCLILGRTKQALRILGKMFEQKRIHKHYWAIVEGVPADKHGCVDLPLAKITAQKHRWHMQVDENGQSAVTHYRVMGSRDNLTWLELAPKTGRTHQLRVHCKAMGWPIVGDVFYGDPNDTRPLMLHARALRIPYPGLTEALTIEAPPPAPFEELLQIIRKKA